MDAGKLVHDFKKKLGSMPDIVYLDPPYNQHPYGSNYHVLNTVTLWDKPDFPEKITKGTKAAIRTDWRTERRSAYNYHRQAANEFQELIDNIEAKYILTSYSTEGNIPLETMMAILGSKGSMQIKKREYVRYRVSPTRTSPKPRNVEFVVITDTSNHPATEKEIQDVVTDLRQIDSEIGTKVYTIWKQRVLIGKWYGYTVTTSTQYEDSVEKTSPKHSRKITDNWN
jgi:adenine-specific DNA-methyltransferase